MKTLLTFNYKSKEHTHTRSFLSYILIFVLLVFALYHCSAKAAQAEDNGSALNFSVTTRGHHTCAIKDGELFCWGQGLNGQLGIGSTTDQTEPVQVTANGFSSGGVTSLAAGFRHTCAVKNEELFCWGWGANGQLGIGSTTDQTEPVQVTANGFSSGGVTFVAAGWYHTCAIKDGELFCWGMGAFGHLGISSTTDQTEPVQVMANGFSSGGVTSVAGGGSHTCAIKDGELFCWGAGSSGRLGTGSTANQTEPVQVTANGFSSGGVTSVAAGWFHTCAIKNEELFCWGANGNGQLGIGRATGQTEPVQVTTNGFSSGGVTFVATGWYHTCAIKDGELFCWGLGANGQLGIGSSIDQTEPMQVTANDFSVRPELKSIIVSVITDTSLPKGIVTSLAAGIRHTCAVKDRELFCWGLGANGQLGIGSTADQTEPVEVTAF